MTFEHSFQFIRLSLLLTSETVIFHFFKKKLMLNRAIFASFWSTSGTNEPSQEVWGFLGNLKH